MKRMHILMGVFCLIFIGNSHGDCFQELAAKIESGEVPELTETTPKEDWFATLVTELSGCTGLTGVDLFEKIVKNSRRLEVDKEGSYWERVSTLILEVYYPVDEKDFIRVYAKLWRDAEGKLRDKYFNAFGGIDRRINPDDAPFYRNFSRYMEILDSEPDRTTAMAVTLIDLMFARSPGQALIVLNENLTSEQVESLKNDIKLLLRLHRRKSPLRFANEDIEEQKDIMNSLISSGYNYIDVFLAEIVHIVHDLKTPEVAAFLEQSTNPLVRRRVDHPFVYVPLESSNMND